MHIRYVNSHCKEVGERGEADSAQLRASEGGGHADTAMMGSACMLC